MRGKFISKGKSKKLNCSGLEQLMAREQTEQLFKFYLGVWQDKKGRVELVTICCFLFSSDSEET